MFCSPFSLVRGIASGKSASSYFILLCFNAYLLTNTLSLAYVEMRLILARMLWNFDLEMMPESEQWNEQKIFSFWDKGPLDVKLRRVKRD
jgi:hypothetical protein